MERFSFVFLVAGLHGCATPRYQTLYRHQAPVDQGGQVCVAQCQARLAMCRGDCAQAYQACSKSIVPLAASRYTAAMEHYAAEIESYARELRHYEMQLWLGWGRGSCCGPDPYVGWPAWYPDPPPAMPSREAVFAQLRREKCQDDCGCLNDYDSCFVHCGGRIVPEVQCLGDCPKQKP